MSQFIKLYFTSSMLNMFRKLIHPSPGACDFSIVSPHWLRVLVSMCVGVSVCLVGVVSVWKVEAQPHWLHVLISTCIGVSVWLVGVVSVWQAEALLQLSTWISPQPATPKLQHTS